MKRGIETPSGACEALKLIGNLQRLPGKPLCRTYACRFSAYQGIASLRESEELNAQHYSEQLSTHCHGFIPNVTIAEQVPICDT